MAEPQGAAQTGSMAGIFISYRRDDASGHAGRLFDRLAARFGRDHVFMDVTDIAPGEDFSHVIETSVGSADVLLAVIGPQWLSVTDAGGARRIDAPSDMVRQEIAAGFQRRMRVIPVLVRGARMPRPEELPEGTKELARRQAVELTDSRWDSDLTLFEQALAKSMPAPGHDTGEGPAKGRKRLIAAVAGVLLLLAGVAYFRTQFSREESPPADAPHTESAAESRPSDVTTTRPATAEATVRYALPLPKGARFRLAGQQFEILAVRREPADADGHLLTILLRMTNTGPYPAGFTGLTSVLESGDETTAPRAPVLEGIAGYAAVEGELQFLVAPTTERATLRLKYGDEETRIPLSLRESRAFTPGERFDAFGRARPAQLVDVVASFPVELALPTPHSVQLGSAQFSIGRIRLDRYNAERAVLQVDVKASANLDARGGINFWSDNLRLHVDDVPRAPVNMINELVAAGTSRTATFEFLLTDVPQRLELSWRSGPWESDRWPLAIPGVQ